MTPFTPPSQEVNVELLLYIIYVYHTYDIIEHVVEEFAADILCSVCTI